MNIHNDPEDFKAMDAVIAKLKEIPNGTITTTENLFSMAAPFWEPTDVDLSGADFELRKAARKLGITLITIDAYKEDAEGRVYEIPFKVLRKK